LRGTIVTTFMAISPVIVDRPYMDPSSVASTPFFGVEVRLLTYIRSLTTASFWEAGP
jgi:hypothetical protein